MPSSPPSLRTQIGVAVGVLVVVVACVLSLAIGERLVARVRGEANLALQVISGNAARMLAANVRQRVQQTRVVASSSAIWEHGLSSPEARELLRRLHALNPSYLWVGVADVFGRLHAATGDASLQPDVHEQVWFTQGLLGPFAAEPPTLLAADAARGQAPRRLLDLAAPIRFNGSTIGVLGIQASWDWAGDILALALPGDNTDQDVSLMLFTRDGRLVFEAGGDMDQLRAEGFRLPGELLLRDAATSAGVTRVTTWPGGRDYLTSVVQLPPGLPGTELNWLVVARQPVDIALADVRDTVGRLLLTTALAAAVAALLGWAAASRISRPLTAIARAARGVERGDAGAAIPQLDSNREVAALSTALQGMTQRLLSANEAMEEQVRMRTRELEEANRALDRQARSDPLTGLLNRRGFDDVLQPQLAASRRHARPLSMVLVDADYFKRINDRFGHDVGDRVLQALADLMRQRLRASDTAARLGGEEFVLLLPDTDAQGAAAIAQELVDTVAAHEDPVFGRITISAGVATSADGTQPAAELLRRADAALYRAKSAGRNRICSAEAA